MHVDYAFYTCMNGSDPNTSTALEFTVEFSLVNIIQERANIWNWCPNLDQDEFWWGDDEKSFDY